MIQIPLNRLQQAALKVFLLLPTQLPLNLRRIDQVMLIGDSPRLSLVVSSCTDCPVLKLQLRHLGKIASVPGQEN
jgi:hypothetical protein